MDDALDRYEFGKACEALYHFAWDEVCDWYLELAKVQFSSESEAEPTRIVLGVVLDSILRLLHPVVPFVTETLWKALTGGESIVVAPWPKETGVGADPVALQRVSDMQKLITEVRRFRSDQGVKPKQKVPARLLGVEEADLTAQIPATRALAFLTEPEEDFAETASIEVRLSLGTVVVSVDTSGTVDVAAERKRAEKDLAAAEKELAATTAKLGNEAFIGKAPEAVVDKIRARQQIAREDVERITARLREMGPA